ncbi:MAG: hypothetical protein ACK2UU_10730 [Anaerolineae bacterium]|jgi:hypothetical protein
MTWFESLTGFPETSPDAVRAKVRVDGETLTSLANGKVYTCGRLETPSLGELRDRVEGSRRTPGRLTLREAVADVTALHADTANAGATFQVASQFNLLEMVSPEVTPERGISIYEYDRTQGPACAIAAGAGTLFRNYFAEVNGQTGQSAGNQIDCLADLGAALGNAGQRLWQMCNGYALASHEGLIEIARLLGTLSEEGLEPLRQRLRIGVQWNTQVTVRGATHTVTQAYCSALPVAYSQHPADLWEPFARLVLEAAYEATVCAAILNARYTGNKRLYLTQLGGGAFGNHTAWISDSITRALRLYQDWNLEVAIVSYGRSKPSVQQLVDQFRRVDG